MLFISCRQPHQLTVCIFMAPIGCKTSTELQDKIKKAFLVDMPDDFYKFWEFCVSLNSDQPCGKKSLCDTI